MSFKVNASFDSAYANQGFQLHKYYIKVGYRSSFSDKTIDLMRMDNKEFASDCYMLATVSVLDM
jgi:hypothetical protein